MKASENIVVKKIEWMSGENNMVLVCDTQSGNLVYPSRITLPSDQLNRVVSDLQKQHPQTDINECLIIEQWSEDDVLFVYDFSCVSFGDYIYHRAFEELDFRQIRA